MKKREMHIKYIGSVCEDLDENILKFAKKQNFKWEGHNYNHKTKVRKFWFSKKKGY